MKIVNNVMKLQSGGEPKRVRYMSFPRHNINKGIGDADRIASVGNEIAKTREWETNWYKGRKATGKFEDLLDDTTYKFMIDRINNSPITVTDGTNYKIGTNGTTTIKNGEAFISANADPTYRGAEPFGNTLESILTHELDHAATIKDMNVYGKTQEEFDKNSVKSATPSLIKVNDIIKGGIFKGGSNDYINNAAEVKARLNSMRREAKMNPARTDYKYEDMKYWLKKYGLDYGKNKSELLMNTVAQAAPTNNKALFAQKGAMLKQDNTRVATYTGLTGNKEIFRKVPQSFKLGHYEEPIIERKYQILLPIFNKGGSLVSDGRRFKFKDSALVRNSKVLNKRDMRKKLVKSNRPTYSNTRIRKGLEGLRFVSYIPIESPSVIIPRLDLSNVFSTYNIPITRDIQSKIEEKPIKEEQPMKRELFNITSSKGIDEFNKWYDEVEKENPEAKHYRRFLTKMAEQESGFNSRIQNRAGAPAYGYFQFMQDGKKYNNISAYAGTDIETFRNNPKLQIKAAIKLAKQFERGFSKKDLELAAQKGYTKFGLLGGAWLAGNGGVRKYLQGLGNPSDKHWSKSGAGTSVADRIKMFNF